MFIVKLLVQTWLISILILGIKMPDDNEDSFARCVRTGQAGSVMACAGMTALNKLQALDDESSINIVDGVSLIKDEQHPRGLESFLDKDPSDFRGILETMGAALTQRSLRWDMSTVYPGLAMRVGPSFGTNGMLEFVLDPIKENLSHNKEGSTSTARILTRSFLVPFLLGFKFNVVTLIPIIFGLLALLAKKAIFVSKFALIISSALGLGSLLLGSPGGYGGVHQTFGGTPGYGFTASAPYHGYRGHPHPQPSFFSNDYDLKSQPDSSYSETLYRGQVGVENDDPLSIAGRLEKLYSRGKEGMNSGRNFAWSESENKAL